MKAELKIEEEPLFFIISLFGDAKLILITVNELNRVWENYVKSKPFSDNRTPLIVFWGRGYDLDTKVCLFCAPFLSFRQD
ncbi:hypothetical protein NXW28_13545 [Bacteroides fragilis]|nr:hypothetical protein [Bacteroides fragilis]